MRTIFNKLTVTGDRLEIRTLRARMGATVSIARRNYTGAQEDTVVVSLSTLGIFALSNIVKPLPSEVQVYGYRGIRSFLYGRSV